MRRDGIGPATAGAALLALLFGCSSAAPERTAEAEPALTVQAAAPVDEEMEIAGTAGERATCVLDEAEPAPCTLSFSTDASGVRTLRASLGGGRAVTFRGRSSGPWSSGTLDGEPAMGLERNRGHVRFSTTSLDRTFAYWTPGNEHGTY